MSRGLYVTMGGAAFHQVRPEHWLSDSTLCGLPIRDDEFHVKRPEGFTPCQRCVKTASVELKHARAAVRRWEAVADRWEAQ